MTLKAGDIIEIRLTEEIHIPPEDEDKSVIDPLDYERDYNITYTYPNDLGFADVSFSEEAGATSSCDIEDYQEEWLKQDIPEIDEYEIFDVEILGDIQYAKIKVLKINEETKEN